MRKDGGPHPESSPNNHSCRPLHHGNAATIVETSPPESARPGIDPRILTSDVAQRANRGIARILIDSAALFAVIEGLIQAGPMVALPNDVARSDEKVRDAFNGAFRAMVAMLGRDVKSTTRKPEDTVLAIAALCVVGMVVARALSDMSLADRLHDAAAEASLELGGWKSENSKSSSRRRPKSKTRVDYLTTRDQEQMRRSFMPSKAK
jgi:hypothetical protein